MKVQNCSPGWGVVRLYTRANIRLRCCAFSTSSFEKRVQSFEAAKQLYLQHIPDATSLQASIRSPDIPSPLTVTGAWRPVEALKQVQNANSDTEPVVAVQIGGNIYGLNDPLHAIVKNGPTRNGELDVNFVRFGTPEGNRVFWHSAAHVLGASLEVKYGSTVQLTDGPAVLDAEGGFFYEMHFTDPSIRMSEEAFPGLEEAARKLASAKHQFERIVVTRQTAQELFADNPFKLDMLERIPADELITVYRCGPFVDLCRGPHLPHTGYLRHLKLHKSSGSHWQATGRNPAIQGALLQRVYGVAFPSAAGLASWSHRMEQAKRRDHRVLGAAQGLFTFHELSPGSTFLLPHGARIYNRLLALLRTQYRARGYDEVITPQLYKRALWRTSGHGAAYADNMYAVTPGLPQNGWPAQPQADDSCGHTHSASCNHGHSRTPSVPVPGDASAAGQTQQAQAAAHEHDPTDDDVFGLKPMNCPGHCIMFGARGWSYRDLPVRYADFSPLHRNEASGALSGLTRVRKFSQDDAHIFCTTEQIQDEVAGCLDFVAAIYGLFGFSFRLKLSTRPETYVGDLATWESAETALGSALKGFLAKQQAKAEGSNSSTEQVGSVQFEVDAGGGAFYGPKIDVFVRDAIGREHQCATVQLDFNLPKRFGLSYKDAEGSAATPVMIHRAILGSVERFMAVLIEHTAGKWPFWLSPRQVLLCPVADRHVAYARTVAQQLMFPLESVAGSPLDPTPAAEAGRQAIAMSLLGQLGQGQASHAPAMNRDTSLWVEVDDSTRTVPKKVREGQLAAWNVLVVVGDAEEANGSAAVRFRDATTHASFMRAWADVDPAAATTAGSAPAAQPQGGAEAAQPGPSDKQPKAPAKAKVQAQAAGKQAPAQADPAYNSPLIVLPVPQLRAVCERMVKLHL